MPLMQFTINPPIRPCFQPLTIARSITTHTRNKVFGVAFIIWRASVLFVGTTEGLFVVGAVTVDGVVANIGTEIYGNHQVLLNVRFEYSVILRWVFNHKY